MKKVIIDILELLSKRPGLSLNGIGIELSSEWSSPYVRTTTAELIRQGLILADKTGKRGHSLTISETGLRALSDIVSDAPGVTA